MAERCFAADITNSPRPKDGAKPPNMLSITVSPFDQSTTAPIKSPDFTAKSPLQEKRILPQKRESPSKKSHATNKRCVRKRPGLSLVIGSECSPSSSSQNSTSASLLTKKANFRMAFKNVASKITDNLYVGSVDVANDLQLLKACKITHIMNLCGCSAPNYFPSHFEYLRLPIRDHTTSDISPLLFALIAYIERVRLSGGVVLVHCVKGISRSTTVAIAYLMWHRRWVLNTAFRFVKSCRQIIDPNAGFFFQLNDWGNQLSAHQRRIAEADDRLVMFRVARPTSHEADGEFSSIPAIEGPFGPTNVPATPSAASTTDERDDSCLIFNQQSEAGIISWQHQTGSPDLLAQSREAVGILQMLSLLPSSATTECDDSSPEGLLEKVDSMRRQFKLD